VKCAVTGKKKDRMVPFPQQQAAGSVLVIWFKYLLNTTISKTMQWFHAPRRVNDGIAIALGGVWEKRMGTDFQSPHHPPLQAAGICPLRRFKSWCSTRKSRISASRGWVIEVFQAT
jgi:hypothetical protein